MRRLLSALILLILVAIFVAHCGLGRQSKFEQTFTFEIKNMEGRDVLVLAATNTSYRFDAQGLKYFPTAATTAGYDQWPVGVWTAVVSQVTAPPPTRWTYELTFLQDGRAAFVQEEEKGTSVADIAIHRSGIQSWVAPSDMRLTWSRWRTLQLIGTWTRTQGSAGYVRMMKRTEVQSLEQGPAPFSLNLVAWLWSYTSLLRTGWLSLAALVIFAVFAVARHSTRPGTNVVVVLFACAHVQALFFLLCATYSGLGHVLWCGCGGLPELSQVLIEVGLALPINLVTVLVVSWITRQQPQHTIGQVSGIVAAVLSVVLIVATLLLVATWRAY